MKGKIYAFYCNNAPAQRDARTLKVPAAVSTAVPTERTPERSMQRHHKTGATHHYEGSGGHSSWGAEASFQPGTFGSRARGFEATPPVQGAAKVPEGAQQFFHRKRSDLAPAHSSGLGSFAVSASSDMQRAAAGRLDRLASASEAAGPPIRWAGASHSRDTAGGCSLLHESFVGSVPGSSHGAPSHAQAGELTAHGAAMESVRQLNDQRRSPQRPGLPAGGGAQELAALENPNPNPNPNNPNTLTLTLTLVGARRARGQP